MRYELLEKPDFTMVKVHFDAPGEAMTCESAAMVARDSKIDMKTSMQGGFLAAAKRKLLGGESIFQNTFTATAPGQTLYFAPAPEGDVVAVEMDGYTPILMNSGCFLGAAPTVQLDTKWGGTKGFFSGSGFFLLKAMGVGPLFFASYGGIHAIDVGPEGYIVDTTHVVGFTGGLDYRVARVGGMKSLFFSGEGLVCELQGQGRVWIQTRNPSEFGGAIGPQLPTR